MLRFVNLGVDRVIAHMSPGLSRCRSRGIHLPRQFLHRHTVPCWIRMSWWRDERQCCCHVWCQPAQRRWCVGVQQLQWRSGVQPGQLVVCACVIILVADLQCDGFCVEYTVWYGFNVCISRG